MTADAVAAQALNTAQDTALDTARDSLADARLLFERNRRTAPVLLDLALRQCLGAISLGLGLDAPDTLPLDILLVRVPSDHPASALAGQLADPRARDADTVQRLIDTVASTAPARKGAARRPTRHEARREPAATQEPPPRPARPDPVPTEVVAGGPTAFEAAAEQRRREATPGTAGEEPGEQTGGREAASTAFWALIDRWPVSDLEALALLGDERELTRKGSRPRFRLQGAEASRFAMLRRIDTALQVLGEPPDWLRRAQAGAPFNGRTPLALLLVDPDSAAERILHGLNRAGLAAEPRRTTR